MTKEVTSEDVFAESETVSHDPISKSDEVDTTTTKTGMDLYAGCDSIVYMLG